MKKRMLFLFFAIAATLTLVLGACSGSNGGHDDGDGHGGSAHVSLTEWSISGGHGHELSLPGGHAALEVHNDGVTEHQLAVWKGGRVEGDMVHDGTLVAKSEIFGSGKMVLLEAELEEGVEYILTCPVPGHTAAGMVAHAIAGGEHGHEAQ